MQIESSTASLDLLSCDLTNKDEAININKVTRHCTVCIYLGFVSLCLLWICLSAMYLSPQATVAVNKATGKAFSKEVKLFKQHVGIPELSGS